MKYLPIAIITTLISISSVSAAEKGKHLFILSGQSNMVGLNPSISFTPTIEAALGKDNVIIVKDAAGGQPIRRWYKKWDPELGKSETSKTPGDLYDRLMKKVTSAIKDNKLASVTFIWMQGESDAKGNANLYSESLKGLLDQVRTDLGHKNIKFVIGRISDYNNPRRYPQWDMIRAAQVEVADADPCGAWVDTDDLNDGVNKKGKQIKDDLHYSVEGYKTLGKRFAEKAIELIKNSAPQASSHRNRHQLG